MNLIDAINKRQINPKVPEFRVGDTIKIDVKIVEGKRERIQAFEGLVTSRKGGGVSETFTVRKKSGNVGVNRIFPLNSPVIDKITVIKRGKVRRSKLNFLKDIKGSFKIKERNTKKAKEEN